MVAKIPSMGPYAPPEPQEADQDDRPMAVARDIVTEHDAAMPTTARRDAHVDPDALARTDVETRAAQRVEGRAVDERGFRDVLAEEEDA